MKICAVICEYNPLHYGHIYQMRESARLSGCDALMCLMSGNFVQRGEPAICDKHTRAKAAIVAGADIVIELPAVFALGNAELFARGAIKMLAAVPQVSHICFGSESGNITELQIAADFLSDETDEFRRELAEYLGTGLPFPKSRELALRAISPATASLISSPNNVLGIEYIRAINHCKSDIIPLTIRREGAAHLDQVLPESDFPSGAAIRNAIENGVLPDFAPTNISESILRAISPPEHSRGGLSALIVSKLKSMDSALYEAIYGFNEAIVARIQKTLLKTADYFKLLHGVKSKHFTMARLKRFAMACLLDITTKLTNDALDAPPYYNVLATKATMRGLLGLLPLPVARVDDYKKITDPRLQKITALDEKAAEVYSAITGRLTRHKGHKAEFVD